jgi:hypothetical protein
MPGSDRTAFGRCVVDGRHHHRKLMGSLRFTNRARPSLFVNRSVEPNAPQRFYLAVRFRENPLSPSPEREYNDALTRGKRDCAHHCRETITECFVDDVYSVPPPPPSPPP